MKRIFFFLLALTMATSTFAQGTRTADKALLIIDMQNDFVDPKGVLCVAGAKATIPAIADMANYARSKKDWVVIYIVREHQTNGLDVDQPRVPLFTDGKPGYCVPGTWGGAIVDGLEVKDGDLVVAKTRNSAFFQTPLDNILRRLGVKTCVLAGTQYPNCVRGTANDAMSLNYETICALECCSAKTPEVAEHNIFDMRNMGIKCLPVSEIKANY
ncbi:MAG: isochorismatase family cysteine hydrolase [Bacteroidales bacterium]|nr:isochorismatase family cysteine hydrolase [Bacteroidales bacterium]